VVESLAVLCWSAVLLYFYASGRVTKYLAPDFRLLCLLGGLGFWVMGMFTLLTAGRRVGCGHDHGHDHGHTHDHGDGEDHEHGSDLNPWFALVVLVLPLGLAVGATRDGFSQAALARKGLYETPAVSSLAFLAEDLPPLTRERVEELHPRDADGYHEFNLLELFFATGDPELQGILDGMSVRTEGRMVADPKGGNPRRRRLYRLFITCCAADSRAIPIQIELPAESPGIEENAWVAVRGTIRFPLEDGQLVPLMKVADIAPAEAPWEESFMRGGF
jgi:uncharacterized repeat protein (TIGR03943 family)